MAVVDDMAAKCPFCGKIGDQVETFICVLKDSGRSIHYVKCGVCGARGPESDWWQGAWVAWANRDVRGIMGAIQMEMKDVTNGGSFYDQFKPLETIEVDGRLVHFGTGGAAEWCDAKWESMTNEDRVKCLIRWEWSKIGPNG